MSQQGPNRKKGIMIAAGAMVLIIAAFLMWKWDDRGFSIVGKPPAVEASVEEGTVYIEGEQIYAREGHELDWKVLKRVNPDLVGWIWIPGTSIDYPIVQAEDNDAYMRTGFNQEPATEGTVFLDYESDGDFGGYHNVIYGHNMKNGTMFHDVVRYKDEGYFKEHSYGVLYTPEKTIYLKMVSAYYGQALPLYRKTQFQTKDEFQSFYKAMLEPCSYADEAEAAPQRLYTFLTCSYEFEDARTYLHAVEISEEEWKMALDIKSEEEKR